MNTPQFVHLRLHTEYSIVDGLVRIDDVVQCASQDKQVALAITDLGNLFGLVKFYQAARGAGIKPIIGCDVWISSHLERNQPTRLLLLAKNEKGYWQLCDLLTRAWLTNQHVGRAEIDPSWLKKIEPGHLIALSGAHLGDIGVAIERGNMDAAKACARAWASIFPHHFYIEIQRADQPHMATHVRESIHLAHALQLPVVATHPIQFISSEHFIAHEVKVCIAEGELLANPRRIKRFKEIQSFQTQAEMAARFSDVKGALANTVEIAKRCNVVLTLGRPRLPDFPTPPGVSIDELLVAEAQKGLVKRLDKQYSEASTRHAVEKRYSDRLSFETDTIIKMGFAGYFLIVAEFISWAKANGVPVGPGRGSGAGSLVAYALNITDLDPLAYNLLFERFLNPERISMPDFDIDFCQEGRERVIVHVKALYGKDAVSQIATFGTMAAKGAVRDVGRALDFSYHFCDGVAKLIPFKPGKQVTIDEALAEEPQLLERYENEEEVKQLLDLAKQVEGMTRNVGMHAGGVLIAPGKLIDFCPLYTQGGETGVVSQLDKDDVEAIGLVKFDFLGLTTLTILNWTVRYLKKIDPLYASFSLDDLPLNDASTYQLLTEAKTVAVFQLESRGMQGMLKDAKPDRFEDIIALVALYRPGPMDLIPDFCRRKQGEPFDYPDPRAEAILKETYGIMVYQEQVMQMAQVIGGYTLGGADLLRRAMGKKKPQEMAEHRQIFREGAAKNGLSEKKADDIFDLMEKFAGYGFNKSHAAAYALLAYYTAYLKAHHPAAFMAANLSLAMDDTDKVKILVEDAVSICGLTILPPDIHASEYRFIPVKHTPETSTISHIRYGLGAIKGVGQQAIDHIISVRESRPFTSLFDFLCRVDRRIVNKRTLEALIRSGALDGWQINRGVLLANLDLAVEYAEQTAANQYQTSLFGDDQMMSGPPPYLSALHWDIKKQLSEEKIALGFYFSAHLFSMYEQEVREFIRTPLSQLTVSRDNRDWRVLAGIISGMRSQMTQRGKIVIVTLDDGQSAQEVTVYAPVYEKNKLFFKEDELLVVQARVSEDKFSGGLRVIAENVMDITHARMHYAKGVLMTVNNTMDVEQLKKTVTPYVSETGCPIFVRYRNDRASVTLRFHEKWRIIPHEVLYQALYALAPIDLQTIYQDNDMV